jgi:hypothetical protein
VRETPDDMAWLQSVLDASYAGAGEHLAGIHTERARLTAEQVVARMVGMQVLVVATVSSDGRPFTGPVDGFLYRGRWCFGTAPNALRARHLRRRSAVSVTHVRGEDLVVTVHGRADPYPLRDGDGFLEVLRSNYGPGFDTRGLGGEYGRAEPDRMYAADLTVLREAWRRGRRSRPGGRSVVSAGGAADQVVAQL